MGKMRVKIVELINKLENSEISLKLFLLTAGGIILVRIFLESFSNKGFAGPFPGWTLFPHVFIWFASVFVWLAVLMRIFTKVDIVKILKIQLFSFVIIWFPVLFDFLLTGGEGARLTYIFVSSVKDLAIVFFTLPFSYQSFGLPLEVIIISIFFGIYVYLKNSKVKWGLLGALLCYAIIFIHLSFPSYPVIYSNYLGADNNAFSYYAMPVFNENILLSKNYLFKLNDFSEQSNIFFDLFSSMITFYTFFAGLLLIFYLWNKNKFKAFFKNLRWLRLIHYWLMFFSGIAIAYIFFEIRPVLNFWNISLMALPLISIACSWARAVGENDIIDEESDGLSNPERPLIKKELTVEEILNLNLILFILAVAGSLIVSYHILIFILLFNAIYFLYSSPPFKLKKIPILNPLLIGIASLSVAMAGFFTVMPFAQLAEFPKKIIFLMLISFALGVNFKDIKDIEGDKIAGVKTLPVIFGEKKGKLIIGTMFFISFILAPIILEELFLLIPAIIFGGFGFFFINKVEYKEKYVILTYLFYISSIIVFYFVKI